MILLGKTQQLRIDSLEPHGAYLTALTAEAEPAASASADASASENAAPVVDAARILLPKNQLAGEAVGDVVTVFVYKDSEDRPIATKLLPKAELSQVAALSVTQVNRIGAFLDWGLPKDLLLPYREQTKPVGEGDTVLVAVYPDKSGRLCATMKLYPYLRTDSPYKKDAHVTGRVYEISNNFGAFVAVDDCFSGLIPKKDLFYPLSPMQTVEARVAGVLPDGKLTLTLREKAHVQMEGDAALVLSALRAAGGFLPYHDKSSAEDIKARFSLGKNAFKRAIGHLYRDRLITIDEDGIRLTDR
ncbi:MAG: RNA-binding protein [Lachnospiraceae bacterium]|nr:RNA-binding protein [Lachnospiraceae bacterium]